LPFYVKNPDKLEYYILFLNQEIIKLINLPKFVKKKAISELNSM